CCPTPHRLRRAAGGTWADQGSPLLHTLLRRWKAAQKGEVVCLLVCATTSAIERGLIGDKPTAAVDGTGLESRHTSRYFFKRAGPEVAEDHVPASDGQAVPQEAEGEPAQAGVRPEVASRIRLQSAQAAARERARGAFRCLPRARVPPAGADPQPHAPRGS